MLKFKTVAATCAALALSVGLAHAQATDDQPQKGEKIVERICADHSQMNQGGKRQGALAEKLALTDAQKSLWKDLADARQQARADTKSTLCTPTPDLSTFTNRLAFREKLMEAQLAAFKATRPKIEAFYNSLDDKQKVQFDAMRDQWREHHGRHKQDQQQ